MIAFYDINDRYLRYLSRYEPKIPVKKKSTVNKSVCGIVIELQEKNYFVPISSNTNKKRADMLIKGSSGNIGMLRFAFMFPVPNNVCRYRDFAKEPQKHKNLLQEQYLYCKKNENKINTFANKIYTGGTDKKHILSTMCNDFRLLNTVYLNYNEQSKGFENQKED